MQPHVAASVATDSLRAWSQLTDGFSGVGGLAEGLADNSWTRKVSTLILHTVETTVYYLSYHNVCGYCFNDKNIILPSFPDYCELDFSF